MPDTGIHLSAKGLADFMTQGDAARRNTLRNFKLRTGEGSIKVKFYAEARAAIRRYHLRGNDPVVLEDAVARLQTKALLAGNERARERLKSNVRAIESYRKNFGKSKFTVLSSPPIRLISGPVRVSATPDLYVRENNRPKLVKFEFAPSPPDEKVLRIILVILFEAASRAGLPVQPRDAIILDVERARVINARGGATRVKRDIEAACLTVADLWPRIR